MPEYEYRPRSHRVQLVLLFTRLKLPSGQLWHVVAAGWGPKVPDRQPWQMLASHAPTTVEYVPAWQAMQAADVVEPTMDWYVPATQAVQFDRLMAPTSEENVPTSHAWQFSLFHSPSAEL